MKWVSTLYGPLCKCVKFPLNVLITSNEVFISLELIYINNSGAFKCICTFIKDTKYVFIEIGMIDLVCKVKYVHDNELSKENGWWWMDSKKLFIILWKIKSSSRKLNGIKCITLKWLNQCQYLPLVRMFQWCLQWKILRR